MLPRRGYEPVDDGDEDNTNTLQHTITGSHRGDHTRRAEAERSTLRFPNPAVTEDAAAGKDKNTEATTSNAEKGTGDGGKKDECGMTVRVLDVRGVFYPLRGLTPETTVGELKLMLVTETGVEIARQRIIHAGKMLGDADTLASRKIADGDAIHLFQRPKTTGASYAGGNGGAGLGTISAQQPGGLHQFPPVLLQVEGGGDGVGGAAGSQLHWEVDGPRRRIRFLASFLLLISILQLVGCLASVSAVASSTSTAGDGEGEGAGGTEAPHLVLPDEYWVLVRARAVSGTMGIVVGMLGMRGSQSLSTQTIKMYLAGLVMCAIVAMAIRVQVFFDIIAGKLPLDYGEGSPSSSGGYEPDGGEGGDTGAGSGGEVYHETAEEARSRMFFTAFSAFISVLVSGAIWVLCIRRVNSMRGVIHQHMDAWERQERGEGSGGGGAREGGGRLMDAVSDPELEGRRRGSAEA
ncbi:unnamed protein product [Scytosiphon promiscuus]